MDSTILLDYMIEDHKLVNIIVNIVVLLFVMLVF